VYTRPLSTSIYDVGWGSAYVSQGNNVVCFRSKYNENRLIYRNLLKKMIIMGMESNVLLTDIRIT